MSRLGFLLLLPLLLLPALLLLGCAGPNAPAAGGAKPGVLRLAVHQDFRSLDPATAADVSSVAVVRLIYHSLLDFDDETNLVPMLAAELPTLGPDKKTWTIHLKKGVNFANEREVVADDIVYSIRRVLDPKTKSPNASYLNNIAGAKEFQDDPIATEVRGLRTIDRYTLEIETTTPDLTLPYLLALTFTAAVPREEVEKAGDDFFRRPCGTGPFALDKWRRDQSMRLKRSDRYSLPGKPSLDAIEFIFGPDDFTRQLMFERGEIDVLELPNGPSFVALKNDPRWQPYLLKSIINATWWLGLNCEMEPFKDKRVRQALNHAIDKQHFLKVVNGRGTIAKGILPPNLPGYNPDLKGYEYDPEKARRLLTEAGYFKNGPPKPVQLYVATDGANQAMALKEDLAKVGFSVELQVLASQVFQGAVMQRGKAACNFWGWSQDFPDPLNFLQTNFHGDSVKDVESLNYFFLNDPETNRLLNLAKEETDPQQRLRLYQQAEAQIMEEAPLVPLFHDLYARPHQPWVHGDAIHPVWMIRYEKLTVAP